MVRKIATRFMKNLTSRFLFAKLLAEVGVFFRDLGQVEEWDGVSVEESEGELSGKDPERYNCPRSERKGVWGVSASAGFKQTTLRHSCLEVRPEQGTVTWHSQDKSFASSAPHSARRVGKSGSDQAAEGWRQGSDGWKEDMAYNAKQSRRDSESARNLLDSRQLMLDSFNWYCFDGSTFCSGSWRRRGGRGGRVSVSSTEEPVELEESLLESCEVEKAREEKEL
ncbi:hypothetical protein BDM02DRAFT_3264597 [Thelephora ganbajun]|uniref:Uncharacterized protein n=1 Tax=Thelephora ganbajun TaxID=370292 RepID=A0ACB6YXP1_THEGA|nr:hypothetical protein BDM02DRAFT_3264597 [Thelephora ganbajun]